jgi:hypothetical protein
VPKRRFLATLRHLITQKTEEFGSKAGGSLRLTQYVFCDVELNFRILFARDTSLSVDVVRSVQVMKCCIVASNEVLYCCAVGTENGTRQLLCCHLNKATETPFETLAVYKVSVRKVV